jgi:replication factor C large subunit
MHEPWVDKYQPVTTDDVVGQDETVGKFKRLALHADSTNQGMYLNGPHGTGKTATVYAFADEHDYEVIELNASDTRKKSVVKDFLNDVIGQQSLLAKGKLILIDEVEGISGRSDRGAQSAIKTIIDKSPFPVVLTGVNAYDRDYKKVRKASVVLPFDKLSPSTIMDRLTTIADEENVSYDKRDLKQLARASGGDLRAAINDFQASTVSKEFELDDDMMSGRDRTTAMQDALTRIFKTTDPSVARDAYDNVDERLDDIFLWVADNVHKEYTGSTDRRRAYGAISQADVFFGRTRRRQYYRFYSYCYTLLSVGVALAKDQPYPKSVDYEESERPLKIWIYNRKTGKEEDVAEALAEYVHTSPRRARQAVLPFMKALAEENKGFGERLADALELEDKERGWLLGS